MRCNNSQQSKASSLFESLNSEISFSPQQQWVLKMPRNNYKMLNRMRLTFGSHHVHSSPVSYFLSVTLSFNGSTKEILWWILPSAPRGIWLKEPSKHSPQRPQCLMVCNGLWHINRYSFEPGKKSEFFFCLIWGFWGELNSFLCKPLKYFLHFHSSGWHVAWRFGCWHDLPLQEKIHTV